MTRGRLEAFSDAVIAIIMTIMVLELHAPRGTSLEALRPLVPKFAMYALSFAFLGIYWCNHHHLLHRVRRISGGVLWANMLLLFWLSLTPFATAWLGDSGLAAWPVAVYGIVLFLCATAYSVLVRTLIASEGAESEVAAAVGSDFKGNLSIFLYLTAVLFAFTKPAISCGLYVVVALMWLIPDRRFEPRDR